MARRNRRRSRPVSDEAIASLHKYYLRATHMYGHFQDAVRRVAEVHGKNWRAVPPNTDEHFALYMYMDYFYAALFVVLEGYEKLGLSDPDTEALLDQALISKLRRQRKGAYHYVVKYYSPEHMALVVTPGSAEWARNLYYALGHFLLRELARIKAQHTNPRSASAQ
jgi:hypothetical protein